MLEPAAAAAAAGEEQRRDGSREDRPADHSSADLRVGGPGGLRHLGADRAEAVGQLRIGRREDLRGQQAGVAAAVDRDRRHRHPARHLHDRQQGVHAVERGRADGDADHGQRRDRGEHAGEVGRPAGARDDHLQAPVGGLAAVGDHVVGGAVGGDHPHLVRHPQRLEHLGGGAHHRQVAVAAHHDPDERRPRHVHRPTARAPRRAASSASSADAPSAVTWPILRPRRTSALS